MKKLILTIGMVFAIALLAPAVNAVTIELSLDEMGQLFGGRGDTVLGGPTNYDDLYLQDDGVIYFNNGSGSYGIRDNSGSIECKNEGGSWGACTGATPGDEGWLAKVWPAARVPSADA